MSKFLQNIEHTRYDVEKIKYTKFICKDCTKKDCDKEFEECLKKTDPVNLLNLGYIDINYNDYPMLYVTTPVMLCPFGVNISNTNSSLTLQFSNYKTNSLMKSFFEFIKEIELRQMLYLGLTDINTDLYNSQIRYDKNGKYDPNLLIKIPFNSKYNRFEVDVHNKNYPNASIMNINKFAKLKCDIYIDKIWKFNEKYICKWKVKKIEIL